MSQHWHISAFQHVDFGANQRGICAATHTDLMHAFLEGVLKYLLRLWVKPLPANKKTKIDYLICHIFGNLRKSEMNVSTFLKKNFTQGHGYTNLTMLTADKWAGMAFTLLVILQSKDGQEILNYGLIPSMKRVITKEERPIHDLAPISHIDKSQSLFDDELANSDSEEDNENTSYDDNIGSVATVFLSLWEFTEILERLLVFHDFNKRGAPYDWIDPGTQESRIRHGQSFQLEQLSNRGP